MKRAVTCSKIEFLTDSANADQGAIIFGFHQPTGTSGETDMAGRSALMGTKGLKRCLSTSRVALISFTLLLVSLVVVEEKAYAIEPPPINCSLSCDEICLPCRCTCVDGSGRCGDTCDGCLRRAECRIEANHEGVMKRVCSGGITSVNCNDGVACTDDTCYDDGSGTGGCVFTPNDGLCTPPDKCTGSYCSLSGCVNSSAVCGCGPDWVCSLVDGSCVYAGPPCPTYYPVGWPQDSSYCNGIEQVIPPNECTHCQEIDEGTIQDCPSPMICRDFSGGVTLWEEFGDSCARPAGPVFCGECLEDSDCLDFLQYWKRRPSPDACWVPRCVPDGWRIGHVEHEIFSYLVKQTKCEWVLLDCGEPTEPRPEGDCWQWGCLSGDQLGECGWKLEDVSDPAPVDPGCGYSVTNECGTFWYPDDSNCDDGLNCTEDLCVASSEDGGASYSFVCRHESTCDDGEFCNGVETCGAEGVCVAGEDPCVDYTGCDEYYDYCHGCAVDDRDEYFCNGVEQCVYDLETDTWSWVNPGPPCVIDELHYCDEYLDACVEITCDPPIAPVLISPADNAVDLSRPVTLTWRRSDDAFSGYQVRVRPVSEEGEPLDDLTVWFDVLQMDSAVISKKLTAGRLEPGKTYVWDVFAVKGYPCELTSTASISRRFTVSETACIDEPPDQPGLVYPTVDEVVPYNMMQFEWTGDADFFNIYLEEVGVSLDSPRNSKPITENSVSRYSIMNGEQLIPSKNYHWQVEAVIESCDGTYDNSVRGPEWTFSTSNQCVAYPPKTPTAPTPNDNQIDVSARMSEGGLDFGWSKDDNAIYYKVWINVGGEEATEPFITHTNTLNYRTALRPKTDYTWYVVAVNDECTTDNNGEPWTAVSEEWTFTTAAADPINLPKNPHPENDEPGVNEVSLYEKPAWDGDVDAESFMISYWYTTADGFGVVKTESVFVDNPEPLDDDPGYARFVWEGSPPNTRIWDPEQHYHWRITTYKEDMVGGNTYIHDEDGTEWHFHTMDSIAGCVGQPVAPSAPSAIYPTDGDTDVTKVGSRVKLEWEDTAEEYVVHFNIGPNVIMSLPLDSPSYEVDVKNNTPYQWRVDSFNKCGDNTPADTQGATWTFTTNDKCKTPRNLPIASIPTPMNWERGWPADQAVFTWYLSADSDPFKEQVFRLWSEFEDESEALEIPLDSSMTRGLFLSGGLDTGTTYYWQVNTQTTGCYNELIVERGPVWEFSTCATSDIEFTNPRPQPGMVGVKLQPDGEGFALDFDLSWELNAQARVKGYRMEFGPKYGTPGRVTIGEITPECDGNICHWTPEGLFELGTTYEWRVTVSLEDECGNLFSRQSPVYQFTTMADCNGNGISDQLDIISGVGKDHNCDGILDECNACLKNKTYTSTEDFNEGTVTNLDQSAAGRLASNYDVRSVWIPASNRGTILRIDVLTGEILGEYLTAPQQHDWVDADGFPDPSRTAVDSSGHVWVANRSDSPDNSNHAQYNTGSVVRIGVAEYGQCVDRNGNGIIDTSTGLGDIRGWANSTTTTFADDDGGVEESLDECILDYIRVPGSETNSLALDSSDDLWVGSKSGINDEVIYVRVLGTPQTGADRVELISTFTGEGGFGGIVDNDYFWFAGDEPFAPLVAKYISSGSTLESFELPDDRSRKVHTFSSIALPQVGASNAVSRVAGTSANNNIFAGGYKLHEFFIERDGGIVPLPIRSIDDEVSITVKDFAIDEPGGGLVVSRDKTSPYLDHIWVVDLNRGVVAYYIRDGDDDVLTDAGKIWLKYPDSSCNCADANCLCANSAAGIAIDAYGKIWVTNPSSNQVMRISPNLATPDSVTDPDYAGPGVVDLVVSLEHDQIDCSTYSDSICCPLPDATYCTQNPSDPCCLASGPDGYTNMGELTAPTAATPGEWITTYDAGVLSELWQTISWNQESGCDPTNSGLTIEVRAADTEVDLGSAVYCEIIDDDDDGVVQLDTLTCGEIRGRFIQIRVGFDMDDCQTGSCVPELCDITVSQGNNGTDVLDFSAVVGVGLSSNYTGWVGSNDFSTVLDVIGEPLSAAVYALAYSATTEGDKPVIIADLIEYLEDNGYAGRLEIGGNVGSSMILAFYGRGPATCQDFEAVQALESTHDNSYALGHCGTCNAAFDTVANNNPVIVGDFSSSCNCQTDDDCNDNYLCTTDTCCTATDGSCEPNTCVFTPVDCDVDGLFCTTDTCDYLTGACVQEETVCDDNNLCTDDYCDPDTDRCEHEFKCTENACVKAECDPEIGECGELVDIAHCEEDETVCTGAFIRCDPVQGCLYVGHDCIDDDHCKVNQGGCVECINSEECDLNNGYTCDIPTGQCQLDEDCTSGEWDTGGVCLEGELDLACSSPSCSVAPGATFTLDLTFTNKFGVDIDVDALVSFLRVTTAAGDNTDHVFTVNSVTWGTLTTPDWWDAAEWLDVAQVAPQLPATVAADDFDAPLLLSAMLDDDGISSIAALAGTTTTMARISFTAPDAATVTSDVDYQFFIADDPYHRISIAEPGGGLIDTIASPDPITVTVTGGA